MKVDVGYLKEQLSIVDVISNYINLEKAPHGEFRGICPFHEEKDPSLYINDRKGLFNCFGCGESGDVIDFLEKIEGINFRDALDKLSRNSGYELNTGTIKSDKIEEDEFIKFIKALSKQEETKPFLDEEILEKYKENTHIYLLKKGYNKDVLRFFEVGYCSDMNDELYNRVTIPWRDADGNLIGVIGRDVTDESDNKYKTKYGSNKRDHFFNLNNAKYYADDGLIVCEDEKSVMRLWQFGYRNAIALGNDKLKKRKWLLRRYAGKVILAFDNDDAGRKARNKAIQELIPLAEIEVIKLSDGYKDIAEIRKKSVFNKFWNSRDRDVMKKVI